MWRHCYGTRLSNNSCTLSENIYHRLSPLFMNAMMTSSDGNIFRVTGHLCGEFTGPRWIPAQKASAAELWYFFHLRLNKRLSKESWGWWFETLSRPLWRHRNVKPISSTLRYHDHLPYFLSISLNETEERQEIKNIYTNKCTYTKEAMSSFLNEMILEEIHATMDHNPYADPNENFNKLSDKIIQLRDKHIPCRLVKFRTHRHRRTKWITSGTIKSIRYKNRLYKRLRTKSPSILRHWKRLFEEPK